MNYDRNHARSLSRARDYYGDESVFVTCLICQSAVAADGYSAVRATAERGVKSLLGYTGPSQVWLCAACAADFGTTITREDVAGLMEAFHISGAANEACEEWDAAEDTPYHSGLWKCLLALGAAVAVGAAIGGLADE